MATCEECDGSGNVLKEWEEGEFEDYLTEIYGEVNVCGILWDAGHLLHKIDPIAFNCAMSDCEEEEECPECYGTGETEEDDDEVNP